MTSISWNVYIDELDAVVNKYNNVYHGTIKMKPFHLKSRTYIDFNEEDDKERPKFKVGDHVRIPKYKNIFAKVNVLKWSEEVFVIKKENSFVIENCVSQRYVISNLDGEEMFGMFYKSQMKKIWELKK